MDEQQQNNNQQNTGGNMGGGNAQNNASQPMGNAQAQAKDAMNGLEAWLAPLFANLPHLPAGGRDFIVKIAPWLALIFGILGILGGIRMLGYGNGPYGEIMEMAGYSSSSMMIGALFNIASSALLLAGFTGLKAHKKSGWNMVFYSMVVSVVGGIVSVLMGGMYGVIGLVIGTLIGFYLIFEIRSSYH